MGWKFQRLKEDVGWNFWRLKEDVGWKLPTPMNTRRRCDWNSGKLKEDVGWKFRPGERLGTQLRCIDPSTPPMERNSFVSANQFLWQDTKQLKQVSGTVDTTTLWRRPTLVAPCVSASTVSSLCAAKELVYSILLETCPCPGGKGTGRGKGIRRKCLFFKHD